MPAVLAVTTTARPNGADYLPATIAALEAAGANALPPERKLLYSDGGPPSIRPAGWRIVESPHVRGSRGAFWQVLQLAAQTGLDLLSIEDDVICSKNAVTYMADVAVPEELAFLSFFDNNTPAGHPPGLHTYPLSTASFIAAQAVLVPARGIPHLLQPPEAVGLVTPKRKDGRSHGRDIVMQYYFLRSHWRRWGCMFPHVVQHVGDVSVCNSKRAQQFAAQGLRRESKNFAGTNFDALKLLEQK